MRGKKQNRKWNLLFAKGERMTFGKFSLPLPLPLPLPSSPRSRSTAVPRLPVGWIATQSQSQSQSHTSTIDSTRASTSTRRRSATATRPAPAPADGVAQQEIRAPHLALLDDIPFRRNRRPRRSRWVSENVGSIAAADSPSSVVALSPPASLVRA